MFGLELNVAILLICCLIAACVFEFINGFHDTANAVASVIYTNSLKPKVAVVWSGIWNFAGVYVGGIAVAIGIINLFPLDVLVDSHYGNAIAMILSLIATAIIWNLATWYFGIPCSSSHTLIGSIFGVGLAFMFLPEHQDVALNWKKIKDAGMSLLISPVFGFGMALLLMFVFKLIIKNKVIFKEPSAKKAPPLWIRSILILTCTGVSFSHGSNDGQKGVGLIMLVLISLAPAYFALDMNRNPEKLVRSVNEVSLVINNMNLVQLPEASAAELTKAKIEIDELKVQLAGIQSLHDIPINQRAIIRRDVLKASKKIDTYLKTVTSENKSILSPIDTVLLKNGIKEMKTYTEYAPWWVILMISLSLGIGTMVGWKRIVVTIGEKIGKTHMTYAQGATAEIIAASTIGVSTYLGLPVSTTHVLSSGVAGTMATGGLKNLQKKTITNILLAWIFTLPVTILLSSILFLVIRLFFI